MQVPDRNRIAGLHIAGFAPDFSGIGPETPVLVGLSGGADSCALLLAAWSAGLQVSACHVHHGLRGDEADADAAFCEALCRALEIPCRVVRLELADRAEETARKGRYEALADAAQEMLLLAHNAQDNLETALFNLSRGTGAAGLGMPPVRECRAGDDRPVTIRRPLLGVTREAIDAYVRACGIEPRQDATNLGDDYARNRLRHQAIPAMRSANSRAVEHASRTLSRLREDECFLRELAAQLLKTAAREDGYDTRILYEAPPPLRSRAFSLLFDDRDLSARHIEALTALCRDREGTKTLDLPGKRAVRRYERLVLEENGPRREIFVPFTPLADGIRRQIPGSDWFLTVTREKKPPETTDIHHFCIDSDEIHGILSVGPRRPGDGYVPQGRTHSVSLKKAFIDLRIPREERDAIPVLRDGAGIVGAGYLGAARRCAASPGKPCLYFVLEKPGMPGTQKG